MIAACDSRAVVLANRDGAIPRRGHAVTSVPGQYFSLLTSHFPGSRSQLAARIPDPRL